MPIPSNPSHAWQWRLSVILIHCCIIYSAPPPAEEVQFSFTQVSELVVKLDQFLSSKCQFERQKKMLKMNEKKREEIYGQIMAQLKELRLSAIHQPAKEDEFVSKFMQEMLLFWAESLPADEGDGEKRIIFMDNELTEKGMEKNLMVMERLFNFGWYACAQLIHKYPQEKRKFAKWNAKWQLVDWHYYTEMEWRLWKSRELIRQILTQELRSNNFANWTPPEKFKVKVASIGHWEKVDEWVLLNGEGSASSSTSGAESGSKNEGMIANSWETPKKKQKF